MTEAQRERHRAANRLWKKKNPDKVLAHKRAYRERHPEKLAAYAKAHREANPDLVAFQDFMKRQRTPDQCRARRAAYIAANPEKFREQQRNKPSAKRKRLRQGRLRTIARTKDKAALGERILANARAAIPSHISANLRAELAGMMAQRVYEGRYPIKLKPEHAKEVMTDHFREFSKFGPVSLDAPRFDDGASTLHDTISEGLWQ